MTATVPTPPVAPVTKISPSSGLIPLSNIFLTQSPAVNPAVPNAIDSSKLKLSGFLMIHSLGTLIYCENPPEVFIPRS